MARDAYFSTILVNFRNFQQEIFLESQSSDCRKLYQISHARESEKNSNL